MRRAYVFLAGCAAVMVTVFSCTGNGDTTPGPVTVTTDSLVKRGEYLVTIGGCDDCHSPKKMGPMGPELVMESRFSGYPADRPFPNYDSSLVKKGIAMFNADLTSAAGPWGISFAANISSDSTGIGNWSEAQFFTALREGKFKGLVESRPLLPPMPWQNLKHLTDEDIRAIFAYLKSTKPVKNVVPGNKQFAQL
ncbi:MAG: diheme cytochrome c-553 [Ferruginibacter sp.]|nr:diheme cytochrome c-553 [Ferruginibacter sp.]